MEKDNMSRRAIVVMHDNWGADKRCHPSTRDLGIAHIESLGYECRWWEGNIDWLLEGQQDDGQFAQDAPKRLLHFCTNRKTIAIPTKLKELQTKKEIQLLVTASDVSICGRFVMEFLHICGPFDEIIVPDYVAQAREKLKEELAGFLKGTSVHSSPAS
jgi:hypothetical protein